MLASEGELVDFFPGDAELGTELLRSHAHGQATVRVDETQPERVLELVLLAEDRAEADVAHDERHLAHVLRASRKNNLRLASQDALQEVAFSFILYF